MKMSSSKENDINHLIDLICGKRVHPKDRKIALNSVLDTLSEISSLNEIDFTWKTVLNNLAWDVFMKIENRNDIRTLISRVFARVGALLFVSDDETAFFDFLNWAVGLYNDIPKRNEDLRADLLSSVYQAIGMSKTIPVSIPRNNSQHDNINKFLIWIQDIIPFASGLVYSQCLRGFMTISTDFHVVFDMLFEEIVGTICRNLMDVSSNHKNTELLVDTFHSFRDFFSTRPEFVRKLANSFNEKSSRETMNLHLQILMTLVRSTDDETLLNDIVVMAEKVFQTPNSDCSTTIEDVFNLMFFYADDENKTEVKQLIERFLITALKNGIPTKNAKAFIQLLLTINSKSEFLPKIDNRIIEIVFDEKEGIFVENSRNMNMLLGRSQLYIDISSLISSLLSPTSLIHLQLTYSAVRSVMNESVEKLKNSELLNSSLVRWNESKLMLLFNSLESISCAKNSLIVMMGIRPSIFELFTNELPLTQSWFVIQHPSVYHMFLNILIKHLKSHEFYMAQSDFLVKDDISPIGQSKRDYARKQVVALELIVRIDGDKVSKAVKKLVSQWIARIVDLAVEMNIGSEGFATKEWVKLRSTLVHQSVLSWNNEIINNTLSKLSSVANWPDISVASENAICEKTKKARWIEASAIWKAGDSKVYMRQSVSRTYQMGQESTQKNIQTTTFGTDEFVVITNFLLKSIVPVTHQKGSYYWMDELLDNLSNYCTGVGEKKNVEVSEKFYEKWRWVLGQTANYCVINKMKTPLGKPMETFNAFSNEINGLAKQLTSWKNGKRKDNGISGNGVEKGNLRFTIEWLRVRLLTEFVYILDKMMTNIMNGGSSFNLCDVPVLSRQFFTTNAQSCAEWLHRTRYAAAIVSYFNGNYGLTILFGWSSLSVYVKREKDEKTVGMAVMVCCWMCRAMAELSSSQDIAGMKKWLKMEFETETAQNVIDSLEMMASGRYETSLVMFEAILASGEVLSDSMKMLIHDAMIDILNRLRLPQALDYYRNVLFGENEVNEDFKSVELLTRFEKIEVKEKRNVLDWDVRQRFMVVESAFSQTMRKPEIADIVNDLNAMGSLVLSADPSCRLYSNISSTNLIVSHLVDKMNGVKSKNEITMKYLFEQNDATDQGEKLAMCRKIMHWARHLKNNRGSSGEAHVEIIRLARKTDNKQLAYYHMNLAMKGEPPTPWMRLEIARQNLKLVNCDAFEMQIRELNEAFGTLAEVFRATCQLKQTFGLLPNGPVRDKMIEEGVLEDMKQRDESMSRSCIQLAEFFENSPEQEQMLAPDFCDTILWAEVDRRTAQMKVGYRGLVGALFSLSAEIYPELSKAHLKLAKWSYELAEVKNVKYVDTINTHITLSSDPVQNEDLWKCLEASTAGQIEKEIRKVVKDPAMISQLLAPNGYYLNLWGIVQEHRSKFLTIAASSYFSFITNSAGMYPYSKKEETTVATLRILDMLVRYGDVLIDVIDNGLRTTNVHIWKEILPQLFSRLSHPSEHIRNTLVSLIAGICTAAPHAVVFQVVSGAASSQVTSDVEDQEEERQLAHDDDRNKVRDCCEQLERQLTQSYPNLVKDVRVFISELEKINLLNEEKWAVVLGTMEHEMEKRLVVIRNENAKTAAATHLTLPEKENIISQKTKLMTSQIFNVLDELYDRTCVQDAVTDNEKLFKSTFGQQLADAFVKSKLERAHPEKAWAPFKNLISILVHRHLRKGTQTFETENISPYLASLSESCVPMPGQESVEFDRVVTIGKVSKQITVLPTKTRPKKISFYGNDGKLYSFLFKGREDLHLDERVMQFLRLCNVMLTSGKSKKFISDYQAHNYAVIPLGPRSGLIKWVEGATPLFHIYRKWQARDKALNKAKNGEMVTEIERPSEMFHRLVRQCFEANKLDSSVFSDRSKWPPTILQDVHQLLVEKTPKDLLSRELWTRSGCATTWWRVSSRYARSCAVMSMIGSVLGLGDRHLDNLLVDLTHGHIVHIDYNICFDKGKNLRIPETVPFRLTQNMVHALGPAQIEGLFKESCIHVLSVLRNGKQVLTMLLDAFVYDPLVDWTNHEHGTASGISLGLQLAVYGSEWKSNAHENMKNMVELFKLRIKELTLPWMNNQEELRSSITSVSQVLNLQAKMAQPNENINVQRVEAGRRLLSAVTRHHSMMKDLRPLVRYIARENTNFAEYYKYYKQNFSDPLLKGHNSLADESKIDIETCVQQFALVLKHLDFVFGIMLKLTDQSNGVKQQTRILAPPGLENVWVVKEDQVENSMARSIVRNVEKRLDGFIRDKSERALSPCEQANSLINDAISVSNLAMMYEGWTAWV